MSGPSKRFSGAPAGKATRLASAGRAAWLAVVLVLAIVPGARAHAALRVRPWAPADADSMVVWAAESRARFQTNTGDSVGGSNNRAYDLVGSMGRRLLQALGRDGTQQAHAVESVLDSLGLDTEVAFDPSQPGFVLLMVRNPYRLTAAGVGFLYWFRDRDLRQQGVVFHATRNPRPRVWWTAKSDEPYEWAIVTETADEGRLELLVLRLNDTATFWSLIQYEGSGPDLTGPGSVAWAEIDHTNPPELIVWTRAEADSNFEECRECPHLERERIYVERGVGFELFDSRLVPSPYAAFTLFIRLLQQQNRPAAARLLAKPARVTEAIAQGWARRGRGVWKIEYAEEGQAWPRWFATRFDGPAGPVRYIVRFTFEDGRWLIRDWVIPREAATGKEVRP